MVPYYLSNAQRWQIAGEWPDSGHQWDSPGPKCYPATGCCLSAAAEGPSGACSGQRLSAQTTPPSIWIHSDSKAISGDFTTVRERFIVQAFCTNYSSALRPFLRFVLVCICILKFIISHAVQTSAIPLLRLNRVMLLGISSPYYCAFNLIFPLKMKFQHLEG